MQSRGPKVPEYVFVVGPTAKVRVGAQSENLAREVVVSSALGSPSADEIRMANEADFLMGKDATIIAVDFSVDEGSARLIETCPGPLRPMKLSRAKSKKPRRSKQRTPARRRAPRP
jgi:hypothetical protein